MFSKENRGGVPGTKGQKKETQSYTQTHKSFKGKRNSLGAKLAGFRGEKSLKKLKSQK